MEPSTIITWQEISKGAMPRVSPDAAHLRLDLSGSGKPRGNGKCLGP